MQNNSIIIRPATSEDISQVFDLEERIYGPIVAIGSPMHVLTERLSLFPEGFNVAVNSKIIGAIRSLRWNRPELSCFPNVSNFKSVHIPDGSNLYITDLFVDFKYRKNGIGASLIKSLVEYAVSHDLDKIQLISERNCKSFYEKMGFETKDQVSKRHSLLGYFFRLPYMEMQLK